MYTYITYVLGVRNVLAEGMRVSYPLRVFFFFIPIDFRSKLQNKQPSLMNC